MVALEIEYLVHLQRRIFREGGCVGDAIHQREFSRDQDAFFIALLVDVLGMRIVRQSNGPRAHFVDQSHVEVVVGVAERPALVLLVLMAVDAP